MSAVSLRSDNHQPAQNFEVRPFSAAVGAEIVGLDLSRPLNDADFVTAWSEYGGHVLALYGEYDIAAISSEGADRIARIVNFHSPGHALSEQLDRTDHNFARLNEPFDDYLGLRFSKDWTGAFVAEQFNDELAGRSIAWMKDNAAKPAPN